jgi:hypothetical protein
MFSKAEIQVKGILVGIFLTAAIIVFGVDPERANNKPAWE